MRKIFSRAFVLVGLSVVMACGGAKKDAKNPSTDSGGSGGVVEVGKPAPDLSIQTLNGKGTVSIQSLSGKIAVIDFWATWCAPCRVVVPKLGALQARYGAQGLNVLGVSTEDAQDVALFAQRMDVRYAVAVDKHAQTTRSYGVVSLPTLVVIDKRGIVRDVAVGYDSSEDARLESSVRSLLAERAPAD